MTVGKETRFTGFNEKTVPGLNVLGTGKIVHDEFNIHGFRILKSYAAVYISRGEGFYYSSGHGAPFEISEGSLFFAFPGEPHRYGPSECGWTQHWAVFNGSLPEMLEANGFLRRENFIRRGVRRWDVQSSFEELLNLSRRRPQDYHIQMSVVMYKLILSMIPGLSQGANNPDVREQLAEEVRIRLNENMLARRSVRQILATGGYSYNYLRAVFREITGESPLQYLNRMRIIYVCEQLSYSAQSIKQIAYNAGFDDPQYFSRMFKKTTGITPGQYRRSILSYGNAASRIASHQL